MRTLASIICFFLFIGSNSPQEITPKIQAEKSTELVKEHVPDTCAYNMPLNPDLSEQVKEMKQLRWETLRAYEKSVKLHKDVVKEKNEEIAEGAVKFLDSIFPNKMH